MADVLRIKRRLNGGAAGAPTSLATAELAFNENDSTLYYGYGDNGAHQASSVIPIAGPTVFTKITIADVAPSGAVAGQLWFDSVRAKLMIYFTDADSSQWVPVA